MTKCEHKNFSLSIVIDRPITYWGNNQVLDVKDKKAMQQWADREGFKTIKRCDDCGEQL